MARLQSDDMIDFTGGLHLRSNEFQLRPNQSPEMLNIDVSPRGGLSTRRGMTRWNDSDPTGDPAAEWTPRNAFVQPFGDGSFQVYVACGPDATIWTADSTGAFTNLSVNTYDLAHAADFAIWGDDCYIVTGALEQSWKRVGTGAASTITAPDSADFNDDYTNPIGGYLPQADCIATHKGYLFVGSIEEDDGGGVEYHSNRLRWSHPNEPEDWAALDYIDLTGGGGRITALCSFGNQLLIFKDSSVWALTGESADSWALHEVSRVAGTPTAASVAQSPTAVYFYSPGRGIYGYGGGEEPVDLSDPLERAVDEIVRHEDVQMAWMGRRLWVRLPWSYNDGGSGETTFIFDPETGEQGSWSAHSPALGYLACPIERSDVAAGAMMGVISGDSGAAAVMLLEDSPLAVDTILAGEDPTPFETLYRTGWRHAGQPELRKSWLRPRYIVQRGAATVGIEVGSYWDYDPDAQRRRDTIISESTGGVVWGAFDWGDGSEWASGTRVATMTRAHSGSPLGLAAAISLRFRTANGYEGLPWTISGAILKYNLRRFTT